MSRFVKSFCALCVAVAIGGDGIVTVEAQEAETTAATEPEARDASTVSDAAWDAIRSSAQKYAAAFNAGDAKAIADLYATNAELVDADGNLFQGRDTIEKEYAAFFKAHPKASMRILVDDVHFVTPTVVMEDGRTETRLSEESTLVYSRYTAVHSKGEEGWRLASVRDAHLEGDPGHRLEPLTWLIGRWVDEDDDSLLEIDCYWHESGAYLIRDFNVRIEGLLAAHGTERIGWDPLRKQVRSWVFDSEGGFLEAAWTRKGEQWTVVAQGFRADGQPSGATYVVTPLREDAYHMESFNRTAGEEELEDLDMTIVRKPPQPADDKIAEPLRKSGDSNAPKSN